MRFKQPTRATARIFSNTWQERSDNGHFASATSTGRCNILLSILRDQVLHRPVEVITRKRSIRFWLGKIVA